MLVNYKGSNVLGVECGKGNAKLILVPGINVIDEKTWEKAEKALGSHIKRGVVVAIKKTTKKDGKEVETFAAPDEIPADQIDEVVNEIKSEAQAEAFVKASTKESVRAKGMNRKSEISKELESRSEK